MRSVIHVLYAIAAVASSDAGSESCSQGEPVEGSALLQRKTNEGKVTAVVNMTEEMEEEAALDFKKMQSFRKAELMKLHAKAGVNEGSYSQYKLTITENYGATGCRHGPVSCIQFAELNLYSGDAEISYEGASYEQSEGEDSPGRETADKAFDGNPGSKYLTRGGENTKVLTITLGTPAEVDDLSFTTGNDAPNRDPKRFTLEGSNDGSTWEMVIDKSGEDMPQTQERRTETARASGAAPAPPAPPAGGSGSGGGDSGSGGGDSGSGDGGSGDGGAKTCYAAHSVPRCGACTDSSQCECTGPGNFCCPSMKKCRCGGGCGRSPEGFTELLPTC